MLRTSIPFGVIPQKTSSGIILEHLLGDWKWEYGTLAFCLSGEVQIVFMNHSVMSRISLSLSLSRFYLFV